RCFSAAKLCIKLRVETPGCGQYFRVRQQAGKARIGRNNSRFCSPLATDNWQLFALQGLARSKEQPRLKSGLSFPGPSGRKSDAKQTPPPSPGASKYSSEP